MKNDIHNNAGALSQVLISWIHFFLKNNRKLAGRTAALSHSLFINMQYIMNPDLSLEVGAHEAGFSRSMRLQFPDLRIFALEASPLVYKHFSETVPFEEERISYMNLAVSETDGKIPFYLVNESGGISVRNSILEINTKYNNGITTTKIEVSSVSGDRFLSRKNSVNVALWVDVEGAAYSVLKSFEGSFEKRTIASVLVEVERYENWQGQAMDADVFGLMLNYGYVPVFCDSEYGDRQYNVIFVRSEDIDQEFILKFLGTFSVIFEHYTGTGVA